MIRLWGNLEFRLWGGKRVQKSLKEQAESVSGCDLTYRKCEIVYADYGPGQRDGDRHRMPPARRFLYVMREKVLDAGADLAVGVISYHSPQKWVARTAAVRND